MTEEKTKMQEDEINEINEINLSDIPSKTIQANEVDDVAKKLTKCKDAQEDVEEIVDTEEIYKPAPKKEKKSRGILGGFCYAIGKVVGAVTSPFRKS